MYTNVNLWVIVQGFVNGIKDRFLPISKSCSRPERNGIKSEGNLEPEQDAET